VFDAVVSDGDHQMHLSRGPGLFNQRSLAAWRQDQLVRLTRAIKVGRKRLQRAHLRHGVAPTLLAGGNRNLLPVCPPLVGTFAREAQHRALDLYRYHRGHAEFHRLLHDPVHLVTAGERLHQHHLQWRLATDRMPRAKLGKPVFAANDKTRLDLASRTIEQQQRLILAQAQHAQRMVGKRLGKRDFPVLRQDTGKMKT